MSTAVPSYILVIDLSGEKPRVLRRFDHHRMQDSMVYLNSELKGRALIQGTAKSNGVHVNGDVDREMADAESPQEEEEQDPNDEKDSDEDEDEEEDKKITAALITVDRIAVSADGQWLATSDNQARTHIFNLDSISVSSSNHLYSRHSYPDSISLASLYITFFPPLCPSSSFRPNTPLHSPSRLPRQHYPDI